MPFTSVEFPTFFGSSKNVKCPHIPSGIETSRSHIIEPLDYKQSLLICLVVFHFFPRKENYSVFTLLGKKLGIIHKAWKVSIFLCEFKGVWENLSQTCSYLKKKIVVFLREVKLGFIQVDVTGKIWFQVNFFQPRLILIFLCLLGLWDIGNLQSTWQQ